MEQHKNKDYDIIFCVFACATIERYKNELLKIEETWGKKARNMNYKVLFFLGEEKTDLIGEDYIYLDGVQNDYLSASYKQNLGLKYIYENYECNYIYITGTDTYIIADNLKKYLSNIDPTQNISIGYGTTVKIEGHDMYSHSGSGGIVITYKTLTEVYPYLENMVYTWSLVPHQHVCPVFACCDVALCYYFYKTKEHKFIIEDKLFSNFNYKVFNNNPFIGCHYMTLEDFDEFTTILENSTTYNF